MQAPTDRSPLSAGRRRLERYRQREKEKEAGWCSILQKDSSLKHPWDPTKILSVVRAGIAQTATLEARLRSSSTLRRAIEGAAPHEKVEALRNPVVAGTIQYFLDQNDIASPGAARLQEHSLMTLVHGLGYDKALDEELVLDDRMLARLHSALNSEFVVVVCAGSQLIRRISELDHVCVVLGFDELIFNDILELMESVSDQRVQTHTLSTLINMAAHPKLQFMLARCSRLIHWLVETVFAFTSKLDGGSNSRTSSTTQAQLFGGSRSFGLPYSPSVDSHQPTLQVLSGCEVSSSAATKSVRILANLLSAPDNRPEIQRLIPSIYDAMLACQNPRGPEELQEASKRVVHLLHDDAEVLRGELLAELATRQAATPLRNRGSFAVES